MNFRFIFKTAGYALCVGAFSMLPSLFIAQFTHDGTAMTFFITLLCFLLPGLLCSRISIPSGCHVQLRDGYAAVACCWIFLSLLGALPYYLSGAAGNYWNALFETVSGLTTTGASIFSDIEALPKSLLLWRSLSQFLGGMGVLVLMLALLPQIGAGGNFLMRAESPGPLKGKLVPKISQNAKILYRIYLLLFAAETICLRVAGMGWFDSICHAMTTVSTGGFSTKNASISAFQSLGIDWIIIAFMVLSGINFSLLFLFSQRNFAAVRKDEELRLYLIAIACASLLLIVDLVAQGKFPASFHLFTDAVFQVTTLITSTGFATADYMLWPTLTQCMLLALMLMGGCAGSTAGGVKCARILLLHKLLRRSVEQIIHPRQVHVITINGRRADPAAVNAACVFFYAYCALLLLGTLVLSLDNIGFAASFSAALTSLSNVGPGLDQLGPSGNFSILSSLSKATLSALMLTGRLEILPVLVLLSPGSRVRS